MNLKNLFFHPGGWAITTDVNGHLWTMRGGDGLTKYDTLCNEFTKIQLDLQVEESSDPVNVRVLYGDKSENLWIGTFQNDLFRYELKTGILTPLTEDIRKESAELAEPILGLFEDKKGNLWIGQNGSIDGGGDGISRINLETGEYRPYQLFRKDDIWPYELFYQIMEDRLGNIWLNTAVDGVFWLDPETGNHFQLSTNSEDSLVLSSLKVTDIFEDADGFIWFCHDNGLDRLDPFKGKMEYFPHIGKLSSAIWSMQQDSEGIFWLNSERGIIRYDAAKESLQLYDNVDGIPYLPVQGSAVLNNGAGPLAFAFQGGFLTFQPKNFQYNKYIPPVAFVKMSYYLQEKPSEPIQDLWIADKSTITLPSNVNILEFEIASLNFQHPEKNQYAYLLEGVNNDWISLGLDGNIRFSQLQPGDYVLRVKGSNNEGLWNETGTSLKIKVLPPWYRTNLAYFIYALTFILGIVFYIRWSKQKLEAENRRLEKLVQEKTQEILATQDQLIMQEKMASLGQMTAGVAHELKNPLNFVTNFAEGSSDMIEELWEGLEQYKGAIEEKDFGFFVELLEDIKLNSEEIKLSGQRADKIITSMMNHSGQTSSERESIDLNKLIEDYAELAKLGYQGQMEGFQPEIILNLVPALPPIEGMAQDLGRVLINLMDNAIYALEQKKMESADDYSPQLQISSESIGKEIIVKIRDNGMGIPAEKRSEIFNPFFTTKPTRQGNTGLGLSISHDIITQGHNGQISVESEEGAFTEFEVRLPV